ncbi:MAG: hypothetical protein JSV74_05845 [Dehalococcoidia bacterium]|nr:MAG: hypothetical protein JSV74_05845 [Dehalococcoidia bacterium]
MKWKIAFGVAIILLLSLLPVLTACNGDTTVINSRTVTVTSAQTITITNTEAKTVTQKVTVRPVADLVVSPHPITGEYQGLPFCYTCHPIPADHQGLLEIESVCFECHVGTP